MHEMVLAKDVLKKVKEKAEEKAKEKVSYVKIGVGASRVSHPAELIELFTMIAKGTIAEGAKLEVEIIPVKGVCGDCKTEIIPKEFRLDCPTCGSTNIQLSSGTELLILEIK